MITITYGEDLTLTPVMVLGYEWAHQSRNVIHPLISNPTPAVTLRPAATKTGTLQLFFLTEAEALNAADVHAQAAVLTFENDDRPALAMRYVVAGAITVTLDPSTFTRWIVAVQYQSLGAP